MPVDTFKTTMQVKGGDGVQVEHSPRPLISFLYFSQILICHQCLLIAPSLSMLGHFRVGLLWHCGQKLRVLLTEILRKKKLEKADNGNSQMLKEKIKTEGIGCLYEGSLATVGSTFVGHYPWFVTFNTLQAMVLPSLPFVTVDLTLSSLLLCPCTSPVLHPYFHHT